MISAPAMAPFVDQPSDETSSEGFHSGTATSLHQDLASPTGFSFENASAANDESGGDNSSTPMQKRRRVTRACDECRRKKIKCDGRQPCTHCTVYSYDCTYDQPSHRRRNPAPIFLEQMEKKLKRAEAIIKLTFPNMSIDDPKFDALIEQGALPLDETVAPKAKSKDENAPNSSAPLQPAPPNRIVAPQTPGNEHDLESMVRSKGTLDLDAEGHYTYFGASSGLNFLQRIGEDLGETFDGKHILNRGRAAPQSTSRLITDVMMRWSSPDGIHRDRDLLQDHDHDIDELPSKKNALRLCRYGLDDATAIISIVHQPTFYKALDRIFERPSDIYEDQDHKFLPLLYTVMAIGCLFAKDGESELELRGYESATAQGYKYFWHARQLMDITDCRDITTLQAIVFMILFLQCSAKLSTCYSYIGVALRSAIRMGMHRSFKDHFSPIELEIRKRLFWAVRKMDVFVSAFLGLPRTLSDEDVDQDYPSEVNDEFITATEIKPMPPGQIAKITAANADFRLTAIMAKLLRSIYPVKGVRQLDKDPTKAYRISYTVIKDIENDLQAWMEGLPQEFKPGSDAPPDIKRIRHLLRMAYAFCQMLLYRPFLHYVSPRCHSEAVDPRSYACAEACVSVSRNIIHITAEMKRNGMLAGSYWFIHYTTFFAVLSLTFYAIENSMISQDMMRDAIEGRETMAALAKRSMAADRCTTTLEVIFEHIAQSRKEQQMANPLDLASKMREPAQDGQAGAEVKAEVLRTPSQVLPVRPSSDAMSGPDVSLTGLRAQHQQGSHSFMQPPGSLSYYDHSPSAPTSGIASNSHFANSGISPPDSMPVHMHYQQRPAFSTVNRQPFDAGGQNLESFHNVNVSEMMFPSADPMAYPNQPILTLEQAGGYDPTKHSTSTQFSESAIRMQGLPVGMSQAETNLSPVFGNQSNMSGAQDNFYNPFMMNSQDGVHLTPGRPMASGNSAFPPLNFDEIFGHDPWN